MSEQNQQPAKQQEAVEEAPAKRYFANKPLTIEGKHYARGAELSPRQVPLERLTNGVRIGSVGHEPPKPEPSPSKTAKR